MDRLTTQTLTCKRCGLTDAPCAVVHGLAGYVTLCGHCHREWLTVETKVRQKAFERFVREGREGRDD